MVSATSWESEARGLREPACEAGALTSSCPGYSEPLSLCWGMGLWGLPGSKRSEAPHGSFLTLSLLLSTAQRREMSFATTETGESLSLSS